MRPFHCAALSISSTIAALASLALSSVPAAHAQAPAAQHRMLVVYRDTELPSEAASHIQRTGAHLLRAHDHLGTAVVSATAAAAAALRNDPAIAYVVEDRPIAGTALLTRALPNATAATTTLHANVPHAALPTATLTDTYYNNSPQGWAVQAVGGYGAGLAGSSAAGPWATTTGSGARIAVLDSGVDLNHPDIAPNIVFNLSEVDHTAQPSACDDGTPQDQSGHGTWVASLAAAAAGAQTGRTVGVAPTASLLNIKVLQRMPGTGATTAAQCTAGQASGLISWVLAGINDAIAQSANVIVLSMSLTLDLTSGADAGIKASFDRVTHAAAQAGAVLIAAAGNDAVNLANTRYVEYPAMSRDVLAVVASTNPACGENLTAGATCAAGPQSLAYYSNYGAPLNAVAAPGGSYPAGADDAVSGWVRGACSNGVLGTVDGPADSNHSEGCFNLGHTQYVQAIGTSASAPLVAGVAALVRAAHASWSPADVVNAIRSSAVPTSSVPYGVVSAAAALTYVPQ